MKEKYGKIFEYIAYHNEHHKEKDIYEQNINP